MNHEQKIINLRTDIELKKHRLQAYAKFVNREIQNLEEELKMAIELDEASVRS